MANSERFGRRDFLVYHVAANFAGGGLGLILAGKAKEAAAGAEARRETERVREVARGTFLDQCREIQEIDGREDCMGQVDNILPPAAVDAYERSLRNYFGAAVGEWLVTRGSISLGLGLIIKAVDSIIKIRESRIQRNSA